MKKLIFVLLTVTIFSVSTVRTQQASRISLGLPQAHAGVALALPTLYVLAAGTGILLTLGVITRTNHDAWVAAIDRAIDGIEELPVDVYNSITSYMAAVQDNSVSLKAKELVRYRGPSDHDKLCEKLNEFLKNQTYDRDEIIQAQKFMNCRNTYKDRRHLKDDDEE